MPPESCQGYFFSKPPSSTSSSTRFVRAARSAAAVAHDLERQPDVAADRPPREEPRRLEDVAVGPLLPRLGRAHAVDGDRRRPSASRGRRRRAGSVVLPQPEGPMKLTKSPRPTARFTSFSACDRPVAGLEGEPEPLRLDDRGTAHAARTRRQAATIASALRVAVGDGRRAGGDRDADDLASAPAALARVADAVGLHGGEGGAGQPVAVRAIAAGERHLVQHHVVQDREPRLGGEPRRDVPRHRAVPLDHLGDPFAPQGPDAPPRPAKPRARRDISGENASGARFSPWGR